MKLLWLCNLDIIRNLRNLEERNRRLDIHWFAPRLQVLEALIPCILSGIPPDVDRPCPSSPFSKNLCCVKELKSWKDLFVNWKRVVTNFEFLALTLKFSHWISPRDKNRETRWYCYCITVNLTINIQHG